MVRIAIWVFILFVFGACSSSQTRSVPKEERFELLLSVANASLADGDPTGALQNLMEAEKLRSDSPDVHHSKALAFYSKQDKTQALEEAKRAYELKPSDSAIANTYGRILVEEGEYQTALNPLLSASQDPLYRDAYKATTNLGILYYRNHQDAKARQAFDRAIVESPLQACYAYYYRGHLNLKVSRFDDAVRDYEKATQRMCGGFLDAHLAIGIAYERGRKYDLARKKFLEIHSHFPNTEVAEEAFVHLRNLP